MIAQVHNNVKDLAAGLLKWVESVDEPAACGTLSVITSLCAGQVAAPSKTQLQEETNTTDKRMVSVNMKLHLYPDNIALSI